MKKQRQKNQLSNPAVATAAASYVAQNPKVVGKAVNIGMIIVGITVVAIGGGAYYYLYWKHRFRKMKKNSAYAPSSVTPSEAKVKADIIYKALYGKDDFDAVYEAMKGVNHNGYIEIYNAFGKRTPADSLFSIGNKNDLTLTQYFQTLWDSEKEKLRNLTKIKGLF
ncbi:hypothetical protein [Capnocytophaga canis]